MRRSLVWRPGECLLAVHPFLALRPEWCVYEGLNGECVGWSVWWLWFELAWVRA